MRLEIVLKVELIGFTDQESHKIFRFRDIGGYVLLLGWRKFDDMGYIPGGRGIGRYMCVIDCTFFFLY